MKIFQADSSIFYKKYYGDKLEIVMSVHVHDVFLEGRPEPLENIKDVIKLKFIIQESGKVKKFLGCTRNGVMTLKVRAKKLPWRKTSRDW